MERIDYREGQTFHFGGFPFTVAYARGGRLVAFIGSGELETQADTERIARLLRSKLDKQTEIRQNSDSGVEKPGISGAS